jgi:hypothetical protein
MSSWSDLLACSGTWEGRNRLQVAAGEPVDDAPSQLTVTPVLHDTFVRLDQAWSWKGEPQAGSMLMGHDPASGIVTAHWADTWHNGRNVMPLTGRFEPSGTLVVHGQFSAGSGPDWGWRIELRAGDGRFDLDMFGVDPTGKDDGGGARATFTRA